MGMPQLPQGTPPRGQLTADLHNILRPTEAALLQPCSLAGTAPIHTGAIHKGKDEVPFTPGGPIIPHHNTTPNTSKDGPTLYYSEPI